MEEIAKRVRKLIEDGEYNTNSFAKKVDIDQSNLSKKLSGSVKFSKRDFEKIEDTMGVNHLWLVMGIGSPYKDGKELRHKVGDIQKAPYYDIDFSLGFNEMYCDTDTKIPDQYIAVPGYNKVGFWCRTTGTSMQPLINSGDIIALREITDWQSFLPMGEVYAIVTTNQMRTVKVINNGSDNEHFTLHAYNDEFADQEIEKASILKVFKVLGALKTL